MEGKESSRKNQSNESKQIRAVAVEEISKTFEAFLDSKPEQQDLISFTKLMLRLINDQNFKIAVTTLQILPQAFSQLEDDELIALSDELIAENVNKFCDSKEIIRNIAAQNLHQLMQVNFYKPLNDESKPKRFVEMLCWFLYQAPSKSITRKELAYKRRGSSVRRAADI